MHRYFSALSEHAEVDDLPDHLAIEVMAENLLNGGTRTYSPHSHIIRGLDPEYCPEGKSKPFTGLRCYEGDEQLLRFFGDQQAAGLMVHPNTMEKITLTNRDRLGDRPFSKHRFYALSSLRSVLYEMNDVWQRTKLHLEDVQISRYYRNLGGRTVEHSVAVSDAMMDRWSAIQDQYSYTVDFCFYEEFAGAALRNSHALGKSLIGDTCRDGEWGSIDRGLYPAGCVDDALSAVPLFAFYGGHSSRRDSPRLLEMMILESGESPGAFIYSKIMEPVIRAWVAVFKATGIIWEPHAQNVVFLCDPDSLEPKAVAFRDADTAVSLSRRKELELSCSSFFQSNVHDAHKTDELPLGDRSEISRVLDVSMGRNTFEYLAALYRDDFGGDPEFLKKKCRELFCELWPSRSEWLPADVYGYGKKPLKRDRNCYPLEIQKGQTPCWRPLVSF